LSNEVVIKSPLQYLDKATGTLRDLGLLPAKVEDAPIVGLLEKISDLDEDKIAVIARTLAQAGVFNEVVRDQIQAVQIGQQLQRRGRQQRILAGHLAIDFDSGGRGADVLGEDGGHRGLLAWRRGLGRHPAPHPNI